MISQRWFQPLRSVTSLQFLDQMLQLLWLFLLLLPVLCFFFIVNYFQRRSSLWLQFQRLKTVCFCQWVEVSFKEGFVLWDWRGLRLHLDVGFSLLGYSNPFRRVLPILSQNLLPAMLISASLFSFCFFHSLLILIICEQTEQYFLLKLLSNSSLLLSLCLASYTLARSCSTCLSVFSWRVFLKLEAVLKRRGFCCGWLSWERERGSVIMRQIFWGWNIIGQQLQIGRFTLFYYTKNLGIRQ